MLSDEELAAFLALLTAFMTDAGISMSATASLFGVSSASLSRWYSTKPGKRHGAARWVANPIIQKVGKINATDKENGVYSRLTGLNQNEKLSVLREVLQADATWA